MARPIYILGMQNVMIERGLSLEHAIVLGEVLLEMANGRRRDAYSAYVPHLHLDKSPPNRTLISEVLGFLWRYCQEETLPELNYLIVEKRSGYPGKFMKGSWKEVYGNGAVSTRAFERFCDLRAEESIKMLNSGFLIIHPTGMILRERNPHGSKN
jgi:hypothetical protein